MLRYYVNNLHALQLAHGVLGQGIDKEDMVRLLKVCKVVGAVALDLARSQSSLGLLHYGQCHHFAQTWISCSSG